MDQTLIRDEFTGFLPSTDPFEDFFENRELHWPVLLFKKLRILKSRLQGKTNKGKVLGGWDGKDEADVRERTIQIDCPIVCCEGEL
jgi:hypothetical protein